MNVLKRVFTAILLISATVMAVGALAVANVPAGDSSITENAIHTHAQKNLPPPPPDPPLGKPG